MGELRSLGPASKGDATVQRPGLYLQGEGEERKGLSPSTGQSSAASAPRTWGELRRLSVISMGRDPPSGLDQQGQSSAA